MASQVHTMDQLNLVCPSCGEQFRRGAVSSITGSDYETFADDLECPNCSADSHPEDALLSYFRGVPTSEVPGRPVHIGGSASIGTIELDVGKVEEVSLVGGGGLDVDLTLLSETTQPPGQSIQQLQGTQFTWYPGPIVVDNESVVVDLKQTEQGELGFITSERGSASSTVTVAYHYHTRRVGIPQPPWVTLLGSAVESYQQGRGLAMLSLLFSSFENLLGREIARTLYAIGWTDKPIDDFLGHGKYWTWEDRLKGGLETVTGKHFPTVKTSIYNELNKLRKTRNNEIIHIDHADSVADLNVTDLNDMFSTVIEAAVGVNELCYAARQRYK